MPVKNRVQYTIRGVPTEVDAALRKLASRKGVSLNALLVAELANAAGVGLARKRRSLEGIAGSWKPDPEFDPVLEEQRQIDWSLWK